MKHHVPTSRRVMALAAVAAIGLSACGDDTTADVTGDETSTTLGGEADTSMGDDAGTPVGGDVGMAMCAEDTPDCDDMLVGGDAAAGDGLIAADIHRIDELSPATRVVEMAPGSVAEPSPLFLQEAVVDGARVTVTFSGGEAPCFVVDHVEVSENEDQVVVTVWAGQPDPEATGCDDQAPSSQAVGVELADPLGQRALLDGSRLVPADAQG